MSKNLCSDFSNPQKPVYNRPVQKAVEILVRIVYDIGLDKGFSFSKQMTGPVKKAKASELRATVTC